MTVLRVKNWERFQHYKDRAPPWIKLYGSLLDDSDFLGLPEAAQAQLVKLWLLASRTNNQIKDNGPYLKHALHTSRLHIEVLITSGFVQRVDPATETAEEPEQWASRYVPNEVRARVLASTNGACNACGSNELVEIDHIVPISKGGTGEEANLQPLCRSCNRKKRVSVEQFATQMLSPGENLRSPHARPRARGEREREGEGEKEKEKPSSARAKKLREPVDTYLTPFLDVWRKRAGGIAPPRLAKALSLVRDTFTDAELLDGLNAYLDEPRRPDAPVKAEYFAEKAAFWVKEGRMKLQHPDGDLTARGERVAAGAR